MTKPQLRLAAVVLVVAIVIVAANALDHLPAGVRTQIDSERAALTAAQSQFGAIRNAVDDQVHAAPDLFNAIPFGKQYSDRMGQASGEVRSAANDNDQLTRLEKHNRRSDREPVEKLLSDEKKNRTQALADATAIQKEAAHWTDAAAHLPQQIPVMERDYQAIHSFDFGPLTADIQRAEADWPDKKSDLESRLSADRAIVSRIDSEWQSTAALRQKAATATLTGSDAGTLLAFEDTLENSAAELPKETAELKTLSAQLYTSWDKLLVDMKDHHGEYQQEIRTVRTHLDSAAAKSGDVTSDEQWIDVPQPTYDAMHNDLGMAIEHKPAGKYDFEAERVPQPAGFAYVAPVSQGSNQYGYWDHRDGRDFWVFYGQYALLRDLLFNHDYRPFDRYEWENYRTYSTRGQTYYGQEGSSNSPKYGTQGTITQNRYSSSSYAKSGGFRNSQYASKSGSYRSSQYASPSAREPNADHSPKAFGHGSPRSTPAPRSYHPSPRSAPRSFGRHH
ncbi:MAG TPA: hypothetical protein VMB03_02150 [Bryobacteraceae bacterium]|nr:hypothetical protein [Bryobacteraceae bacterium]